MQNIQAVVLAAGKSTRFKTGKSKLVEKICGQEMILYGTKLLEELHIPTTVVVGFQKEDVINTLSEHMQHPVHFVEQEEQRGTGHAVACTRGNWTADYILIMNGDMPLVSADIVQELFETHQRTKAVITFVTSHLAEPSESYGRVIKKDGTIHIIEANEFTGNVADECCINAGIYLIRREFLEGYIDSLDQKNVKQEFYLTDLVKLASDNKLIVETIAAPFDAIRGINTLKELWMAEQIKRSDLINHWMLRGVRFSVAQNVHVDLNVSIGAGTYIGAGVQLRSGTIIGSDCIIGDFSIIEHGTLADKVIVHPFTLVSESRLETGSQVGPYAHIRNHSIVHTNAAIGNFVELKKTIVGSHTKAKHLSYLGDAVVGEHVNIGAGTITCNHDGISKHTTTINDGAYIGSNNALVAPVTIGKNSFTAAGSTITEDVPSEALAIARERQVNKLGYAKKLKKKAAASDESKNTITSSPFFAALKTAGDASFNPES